MKEIKFRAWDTLQGGKFEYWDSKTDKYDGIFWTMIKNKSFKKPEQFTGVTDKNGKEIFEGDTCKDKYGKIGIVEYFNDFGGFIARRELIDRTLHIQLDQSRNKFEVIGNIHDKP